MYRDFLSSIAWTKRLFWTYSLILLNFRLILFFLHVCASCTQAAVSCWCISWSSSIAQGGSLIWRLQSSSTLHRAQALHTPELAGAMGLDVNSPNSPVGLFCVNCVSLSLTEGFSVPPFFMTGFFKVLGQLTETGVASPEQFISEYIIISWHFHRGCWEPKDSDADSKSTRVWSSQLPDARGIY